MQSIFGIAEDIKCGIFKLDSIRNKNYILLCLKDLNKYKISIDTILFPLKNNELFLVFNYSIKKILLMILMMILIILKILTRLININTINDINDINEIILNNNINYIKKLSEEKNFSILL